MAARLGAFAMLAHLVVATFHVPPSFAAAAVAPMPAPAVHVSHHGHAHSGAEHPDEPAPPAAPHAPPPCAICQSLTAASAALVPGAAPLALLNGRSETVAAFRHDPPPRAVIERAAPPRGPPRHP